MPKVLAIAISVLTVVLMMGPTVEAGTGQVAGQSTSSCICFGCTGQIIQCSTYSSLTCGTKRKVCSIGVETLLKALGNLTSGPNSEDAALQVTVFLQEVRLVCRNSQGKQQNANAPHFVGLEVPIVVEDFIEPASVQKNGKATSNVGILDADILAAIGVTSTDGLCPNKINWTVKPLVEKMRVLGELFYDPDPSNDEDNCVLNPDTSQSFAFTGCGSPTDALGVQCFAPAGAKVGAEFEYVGEDGRAPCDTLCHNNDGILCGPDGLPVP